MTNQLQPCLLRIDVSLPVPVYRQIMDGLRALLVGGQFKPGQRLPTVRQLATDLAVNHNTVAEAYRFLEQEGWLKLRRHHGATVLARSIKPASPVQQADFARRLRELAAHGISAGLEPHTLAKQLRALADNLRKKEVS